MSKILSRFSSVLVAVPAAAWDVQIEIDKDIDIDTDTDIDM